MHLLSLIGSERMWARKHLLLFCLPLFFIALTETGMAYIFPLIVIKSGVSNTLFGLIAGGSAMMAILLDIALPRISKLKGWRVQLLVGTILALLFPLLTLGAVITGAIVLFILASISWYIFYELLMMSEQSFVIGDDKTKAYSKDWGEIYFIWTLASIAGPIIAQTVEAISITSSLLLMSLFTFLSLIFAGFAAWVIRPHHRLRKPEPIPQNAPLKVELKYFRLFSSRIFPILIISAVCLFIEEIFWHFGALLGESVHIVEELNWLVITLFSVPMLIGPLILSRLSIQMDKKKLAILAVMLSGVVLSLSYFTAFLPLLFGIILITGIVLSFTMPLSEAVFSEYLKRAGHSELHLISLIRITASVAYFLSPVIGGILADWLGYRTTFATVGIFAAAIAAILLIVTPKKIQLPQKELHDLELGTETIPLKTASE